MAFADDKQEAAIKMQQATFVPAKAEIVVGTLITWTNTDTLTHSVTAVNGRFDSGPILPGKSFQWTPKEAGIIAYHCIFHPSMTAVLKVRAGAARVGQ